MSWGTKNWGYSPWGDPEPAAAVPLTSYEVQAAKQSNFAFYFVHIEGFPYLWTTNEGATSGWVPPAGFTLRPGLLLTPHDEVASFVVSKELDVFSGVEDAESVDLTICDTLLHTLFAVRKPKTTSNAAQIVTNNIAAGSDANIVVATEILDAPSSNGTIYLGSQTVTYLTKSGTTFSGVDRGRYAILNDTLNEIRWKPFTDWDAVMNIPLMVTTFPQRIEGRVMTVYRCYRHPDTEVPLSKAESQIRFRGKITAYGMQSTPNGYDIHANSIIAELDSEIMSKGGSCELAGYALVNAALDDVQKSSTTKLQLELCEEFWVLDETSFNGALGTLSWYPPRRTIVEVGSQFLFKDADELISAINDQMASLYAAGTTRAPWFLRRGQGGRLLLGYHCVGFGVDVSGATSNDNTVYPIPKGNAEEVIAPFNQAYRSHLVAGIKGSVRATLPFSALGFGSSDGSFVYIGTEDVSTYQHNFAQYINPAHGEYSTYLLYGDEGTFPYEPQQSLAKNEVAQAWFRMDYAPRVPTNVEDTDGFIETLEDESPFLIKVGEKIVYRVSTVEYVSQDFLLVDANYDYWNPIATARPPEEEYLSVPESARGEDVPKVRQVYMPSGLWEETGIYDDGLGGTFPFTARYHGVNFTILQLLTSTGTSKYNGDFDILPRGWGLGIPEEYIDVDSFKFLFHQYPFDALQRRWLFDKPTIFREFIEAEAKTLGFLVMVHEGKITAVPSDKLATNALAVMTIDDSVRVMGSDFSWRTAPEGIFNVVKLSLDYDYLEDKFYTHHEYHDRASQVDSRVVNAIEIENKGLASTNFRGPSDASLSAVQTMMRDRLNSYSREVYEYTCTVCRKADGLKVGDIVYATDNRIPNHLDGTVGISWHMGRITRYEFDELAGMGELTVRLNYEFDRKIAVFADTTNWNSPMFSPSAQIASWMEDNQAIFNTILHNPDGFSAGQVVVVTDMSTGDQWETTISSIDLSTGAVTFSDDLAAARASANELIMQFADFASIEDHSTTGSEYEAAFIGGGYFLG